MIRALSNGVTQFDILVISYIYSWNRRHFLDSFFYWISKSGDGYLYGICGILFLITDFNATLTMVVSGLVAFAFELPLYQFVKRTIKRIRPFECLKQIYCRIIPPDKFSFPSGHTAAAFLMANLIANFHPEFSYPLFVWASLVGFSRVYLGVHYPTDVLAGMLLGILTSNLGLLIGG
jgi:undecaprenyl-diphosphatase